MSVVLHKDLRGADLHPPGPHTHPDTDLSSFATLDARYYIRSAIDALLASVTPLRVGTGRGSRG